MNALRAAARGIRRALSLAARSQRIRRASVAPRPLLTPSDPLASDEMLQEVRALQLASFRRTFSRYTRDELAQLGTAVASIPDAAQAVAEHFTDWDTERIGRAQLAASAAEHRAEADTTAATLIAHLSSLVPLILRRAALRALRPLCPRAPAPAGLA